jgi:plasmid stability protein
MPGILIRDIPEELLNRLKMRARANSRSLQQELKIVLAEAVNYDGEKGIKLAAKIRRELEARKVPYSDSAELIREDRER